MDLSYYQILSESIIDNAVVLAVRHGHPQENGLDERAASALQGSAQWLQRQVLDQAAGLVSLGKSLAGAIFHPILRETVLFRRVDQKRR